MKSSIIKRGSLLLAIIIMISMLNVTFVNADTIAGDNTLLNEQGTDITNNLNENSTDPNNQPGNETIVPGDELPDGEQPDGEQPVVEVPSAEIDFSVDTDGGFEKVASTESLDLYFDKEEIAIRLDVKDASGNVTKKWRSQLSPKNFHIDENFDGSSLSDYDKRSMSFIQMDYINLNKSDSKKVTTTSFSEQPKLVDYEKTGAGIKFRIFFDKLNIKVPISIEIVNDEMDVRVPKEEFYENTEGMILVNEAKKLIQDSISEIQVITSDFRKEINKIKTSGNSLEDMKKNLVLNNLNKLYADVLDLSNSALGNQYTDLEPDSLRSTIADIDKYSSDDFTEQTNKLSELIEICIEQFEVMKTNTAYGVINLTVMPYFGYGTEESDGYVFYPDGSGAISYYDVQHPRYVGNYSQFIYHEHSLNLIKLKTWGYNDEYATLPVYGVKQGNNGFVSIITDGDYDATINYWPRTTDYSLSRVFSTYIYRREVRYINNNASASTMYEGERLDYTRNTKYVFLIEDDANYSGMARAYRNYLNGDNNNQEQLLNKAIQEGEKMPFAVDFMMGVKPAYSSLANSTIEMTTYEQAQNALQSFRNDGIDGKIYTNLYGWTKATAYQKYPDPLKVNKDLGGEEGLMNLTSYAKDNNIQMSLGFDPVQGYRSDLSWGDLSNNVATDTVDVPIEGYSWYLFSPKYIQNRFAEKQVDILNGYGANSANLSTIGHILYYDFNEEYGGDRSFTAESFRNTVQMANDKLGGSSVDVGNAYILKNATKINKVSDEDNGYFFNDETVPFYQMIVHGSIPYSSTPYNLLYDEARQKLQFIENGSMPYFFLTYESADKLRDTNIMRKDNLYTSELENWYDKAVEVYKEFDENFSNTWDETIDNHEVIANNVKKVTYSDGTVIYLNYNNKKVENIDGGITLEPVSYKVVEGGLQ